MPVTITDSATIGRTDHWAQTIQERRQYIADTARCRDCGTDAATCRNDTTGDTSGPGSLCCWSGSHRHIEDPRMVDQLMKEIMAGEVRTVAEAYPPPRQGPKLPGYNWLLHQDTWWYPYRRPAVRIAEMDKPWRYNTARFIERHALDLHLALGMPGGMDVPDDVWAAYERETPLSWLRSQRLMKALSRGLPSPDSAKGRTLAARAAHWNTCPMRLAHPGAQDRCVCVRDGGRVVGATNDPVTARRIGIMTADDMTEWAHGRMSSTETYPEPG